jgi:hypothetical protein
MGSLGSGRLTWLIQDSADSLGRLAIPAAGAGDEAEAEASDDDLGWLAITAAGTADEAEAEAVIFDEVGARGALLGDGVRSRLEADEAEAEAEAASRAAAFSRSSSSEKFQWGCPAETANGARAADHAVAAASLAASSASCMSSAICSDSQASDQPNPKVVSDYCVSHAELSRSSDTFAVCSPHTRSLLKENATET